MKYPTVQSVPTATLMKWLASAERLFGARSSTARVYRSELQRRAVGRKVVAHAH